MYLISNIRRFKWSGFFYMIGLSVAIIVILQLLNVLENLYIQKNSQYPFSNTAYYSCTIDKEKLEKQYKSETEAIAEIKRLFDAAEDCSCNVTLMNQWVQIGYEIQPYFVDVLLATPQGLNLKTSDNTALSDVSELRDAPLIIGQSILPLTEHADGKILKMFRYSDIYSEVETPNGTADYLSIPVGAVLKDYSPAHVDYTMKLYFQGCSTEMQTCIMDTALHSLLNYGTLKFEGNQDIDRTIEMFQDSLKDSAFQIKREMRNVGSYTSNAEDGAMNEVYRDINLFGLTVCGVFALFACFSVSGFFANCRQLEFAVRKAYGYSNFKLFILFMKDTIMLAIPAVVIAFIISMILSTIFDTVHYALMLIPFKILAVIIGVILIAILCALNSIQYIAKIPPVLAVKGTAYTENGGGKA